VGLVRFRWSWWLSDVDKYGRTSSGSFPCGSPIQAASHCDRAQLQCSLVHHSLGPDRMVQDTEDSQQLRRTGQVVCQILAGQVEPGEQQRRAPRRPPWPLPLLRGPVIPTEAEELRTLVQHEMEHVAEFSVPIVAEVGLGPNWRDIK